MRTSCATMVIFWQCTCYGTSAKGCTKSHDIHSSYYICRWWWTWLVLLLKLLTTWSYRDSAPGEIPRERKTVKSNRDFDRLHTMLYITGSVHLHHRQCSLTVLIYITLQHICISGYNNVELHYNKANPCTVIGNDPWRDEVYTRLIIGNLINTCAVDRCGHTLLHLISICRNSSLKFQWPRSWSDTGAL